MRTQRQGPPEVWFRILHIAPVGYDGVPEAEFHEQTVEIVLVREGAFERPFRPLGFPLPDPPRTALLSAR